MRYDDFSDEEEFLRTKAREARSRLNRSRAQKKAEVYLAEEEGFQNESPDDLALSIRQRARAATTSFLDECDSARGRAKEKDANALKYIDDILVKSKLDDTLSVSPEADSKQVHEPSQGAKERMRKIHNSLEGILDYEMPAAERFTSMRHLLRDINDKMAHHRLLLDRYSSIDLRENNETVNDRVDSKYNELVKRNPLLESSHRDHAIREEHRNPNFDPELVAGYVTGVGVVTSDKNSELRGRIRNLICRTRGSGGAGHPGVATRSASVRKTTERQRTYAALNSDDSD